MCFDYDSEDNKTVNTCLSFVFVINKKKSAYTYLYFFFFLNKIKVFCNPLSVHPNADNLQHHKYIIIMTVTNPLEKLCDKDLPVSGR